MRRETNPTSALITGLALMTLGTGPLPAHAHGGPPSTYDVLLGSGSVSLVTSHGFFSEDADWEWICEEATSADLAPSSARSQGHSEQVLLLVCWSRAGGALGGGAAG